MTALDPRLLVAVATSFVGLGEQGGANRGQVVELFLREVRQPPGQPWCAAFVHHVGYWSHYDHATRASHWPLPATASCWELGEFARARGVLREDVQPGDVFLVYTPHLKRFAHTGIVVSIDSVSQQPVGDTVYCCTTIEGNTNQSGSREGTDTLRTTRVFSIATGDRFIRWTELQLAARAA
jgi:hypothetical protein